MHLMMILFALGLAWSVRGSWSDSQGEWSRRWQRSLLLFLFSPLLLIMTAVAVLCMGPQGRMVGFSAGWFSYLLALGFFGLVGILGIKQALQGWRSVKQTRTYPLQEFGDRSGRVLDTPVLFSALIGFWQPELVVSQGMLNTLAPAHLDAVIEHEQAHHYYRDTFWFFWLGWARVCTAWLPNTEALWQELLLLRELRADRWAAQKVDPLLLAESLLMVVSYHVMPMTSVCTAFSDVAQTNRLTQRIEALLAESESPPQPKARWSWIWLLLTFLPLATVPFHT